MTLILIDGLEDKSCFSQTASSTSNPAGRHGNCLRGDTFAGAAYRLLPAHEADTLTIGVAVRFTAALGSNTIVGFKSDTGGTQHVDIWSNTDGSLSIRRGGSTTLGTTAAGLIVTNTWAYIELQSKLHDTTGFYTLRVNGAQVLAATNVDTKNAGTKTVFDTVQLTSPITNTDWDDLYLMSGTGDVFMGDITVETLYPNGNGNANQWVGSDADSVNNYLLVDEVGAPVTTDYTATATVGQQDLYTLTDLVGTGSIVGVCHSSYLLRTDALSAPNVKLVNRRSADTKSVAHALGTAYRTYDYALTTDPETSSPWTITNVNALQSGVELA